MKKTPQLVYINEAIALGAKANLYASLRKKLKFLPEEAVLMTSFYNQRHVNSLYDVLKNIENIENFSVSSVLSRLAETHEFSIVWVKTHSDRKTGRHKILVTYSISIQGTIVKAKMQTAPIKTSKTKYFTNVAYVKEYQNAFGMLGEDSDLAIAKTLSKALDTLRKPSRVNGFFDSISKHIKANSLKEKITIKNLPPSQPSAWIETLLAQHEQKSSWMKQLMGP